ncbi:MerR family transcriptional regulator [Furfurilactobacillus sp. WILCCON 0119]|uniref:MerR family transcriptional regulator n=1 Tax=Furfurilactobacillus entadae TaxID=2922307 RepID=UPI0035E4FC15
MAQPSLRSMSNGKIFSTANLIFGIGELSKMTGTSTRQLRYWESKGYLQSKERIDEKAAREYGYDAFLKASGIKLMLDEGYTLAASVERTEVLMNEAKGIRNFLLDAYHGMVTENGHHVLDLGYFDQAHTKRLFAYSEDHTIHYEVRDETGGTSK